MSYPFQPKPGPPPGHQPAATPWPAQDRPVAEAPSWADDDAAGDAQTWNEEPAVAAPPEGLDAAAPDAEADLDAAGGGSEAQPGTGHPAVDAVLRSLANAAQLPPAEQIAEYEAAHRVLQETLASIDG
jgi:hypothetical protein